MMSPSTNVPESLSPDPGSAGLTSRIVEMFLHGNLSAMLVILSLIAGAVALLVTPREEEPQIIVPLADVHISVPGASAEEVERQVALRLEKMLYQIDGVEYVYSMSRPHEAVVTVRFYVGEDREDSLVKIYNKIQSNTDAIPPQVAGWVVKPIEVDDVPIVDIALWSDRHDDFALRRVAEEMESRIQSVPNTGRTRIVGGRPRQVRIEFDTQLLAGRQVSPEQLANALRGMNTALPGGSLDANNESLLIEAGDAFANVDEIRRLVVAAPRGNPVYLGDVAEVVDGPTEPLTYTRIGFGPAAAEDEKVPTNLRDRTRDYPAVHIAVAKKKGANAVTVARAVQQRLKDLREDVLPAGVYTRITRNYGETANQKVNELVEGLAVAIVIVIALIALTLGWREGLIIATAVPITFALTLLVNYLAGYTINRVTLFALILALGLVVDDPIVDVENIYRHLRLGRQKPLQAVLTAVNEVRPPIILATLAVIISFVPMFFITGMMGPYMRPMALNVPLAMLMSLVVAFTITPWMTYHVLKGEHKPTPDSGIEEPASGMDAVVRSSLIYRVYRTVLNPFLRNRSARWMLLAIMVVLFGLSGWLAASRRVPLKMLPFDNKNEFQVVVDMPEGTTLETTESVTAELASHLRGVPEVTNVTTFVGTSSPMDFNGMVRHYYLRRGSNVADIRVNLVHKHDRMQQSHALTLRLRNELTQIATRRGANIKLVEMPPGPPVISTITAEVYGQPYHAYEQIIEAAREVRRRLELEPAVVDVDDTIEADQTRLRFVLDKEKASLSDITGEQVAALIRTAIQGSQVSVLKIPDEVNPLPIVLQLPKSRRSHAESIENLYAVGRGGRPVPLAEIGHIEPVTEDKTIYHKNLRRVVYVFAETAGRAPAEAILDIQTDRTEWTGESAAQTASSSVSHSIRPLHERTYLNNGGGVAWSIPAGFEVDWAGEGEWNITIDVMRDLGLAFAAACLGIYVLLVYETESYLMPLILMISIPLTIIGIMPGFWLLNALTAETVGSWQDPVFFTATAMIGMIALSGIAVRNAILLIEFVHRATGAGQSLTEALLASGAVRLRPIFLTAGTAMLAAWPITLDPIFSGLAWALIFGLLVSTLFTLVVIPVVYYMAYNR
ncbi:MAG: efflux RND transporter permease subunit [Phycisphaerales bacterium]|nr:MAG: efflux RND transporter permease subunit [Phycisphaerales bacterium]